MDDSDVKEIVDAVRALVRERVVPREAEMDETDEMPAELREAAAQMGLYGFAVPEEYGARPVHGAGGPARHGTRLHDARVPLAVRHQQRHRRTRPHGGRHRGAEKGVSAPPGVRRVDGVLRPHLVCIPQGRDQGEVARHVKRTGAGVTVSKSASPRTIARAVDRVLHGPSYRREAQRMATEIAAETSADKAVSELEALAEREQKNPQFQGKIY